MFFSLQIFEIVKLNQKSPFDTCYFLNHCGPDDIEETTQSSPAAKLMLKADWGLKHMIQKGKQPSSFENIFGSQIHKKTKRSLKDEHYVYKVAQITDIHVDQHYLEVNKCICFC